MYDYTLYNSNCVLHTETNTIIYEGEDGWNLYKEWVSKNPKEDSDKKLKAKNLRIFNGGQPHIKGDEKLFFNKDGILVEKQTKDKSFYYNNKSGELVKVKVKNEVHYYNHESIVKKEYFNKHGKYYEKHFSIDGHVCKKVDILKNISYEYNTDNSKLKSFTMKRNNLEYKVEYRFDSTTYKTTLKKFGVTIKEVEYYPFFPKQEIKWIKKYINNKHTYREYYTTGVLRTEGTFNDNEKMDGSWNYYHHNGVLESENTFRNGYLIGKSYLYYENGNLVKEIYHG